MGVAAAHHHLQIDSVEQWPGEPTPVAPPFRFATAAGALRVAPPTAGARIGGAHQGNAAGEAAALTGAADPHLSLLKGLAQLIEHGAAELGQLIEEQHTIVGQAQLPRSRQRAAANQGRGRAAVVWAAEGTPADQASTLRQQPRHRVQLGEFQGLPVLQGGQQRQQAAGQHRLAGARGADQQQVMVAGGGDLQGPAAMHLAPHLGEIEAVAARSSSEGPAAGLGRW